MIVQKIQEIPETTNSGRRHLDALRQTLPPIIARTAVSELCGGLISARYLANLDSEGRGPERVKIGRRVGYLRDSLVDWLESRITEG